MIKKAHELIEQIILESLQKGTLSTIALIKQVSVIRKKTTKQGVYRVLRKLKNEEKIVIHGKLVSLNLHWIKKMNEFFSLAQFYYSPKNSTSDSFLNIKERDRIVYFFKNLNLLDSFWSHVFHMLSEISNQEEPIYVYNPHEWFFYARQETEQTLIKAITGKNKQIFITVSHADPLDKKLKNQFTGDFVQYDISEKNIFKNQRYYFNIFGNYLIEVFIDEKITKQIDDFFKKTSIFDIKSQKELLEIVSRKGNNKLVISKNSKKANKYKKALSKNFFIKK